MVVLKLLLSLHHNNKQIEIMKNYMALSFNTTTNQSEEVYVMANNLKEAKSKVANCIMICKISNSNNSKMYF